MEANKGKKKKRKPDSGKMKSLHLCALGEKEERKRQKVKQQEYNSKDYSRDKQWLPIKNGYSEKSE